MSEILECPTCGYQMTRSAVNSIRGISECPGCKRSLTKFKPVKGKESENEKSEKT